MGLFGGIVINVMRNNLSVGIVCMTIDSGTSSNNSNNASIQYAASSRSVVSVLFPNYGRSGGHSALNDEFENCPNEITSDGGYGEVIFLLPTASEGWGKIMFSVCSYLELSWPGGTYPGQGTDGGWGIYPGQGVHTLAKVGTPQAR